MNNEKNHTMIQSLQVGMSIVDIIAAKEQPLKFSEIQELTHITKSNLYKYLNTLTHLQLLYRDKRSGAYMLGSKIIEYGRSAIGHQDIIATVTPFLQELGQDTSLTVLLVIESPNGPVVANIWNTNHMFNIGAQIGTQLPILSATGKVFSAFPTSYIIQDWKKRELDKLTLEEKTMLAKEEQKLIMNGISLSKEALVQNVISAASPIFNYNMELLGTITLVGFLPFFEQDENHAASQKLIEAAKEVSHIFGYQE
ncbi:IclR family transcriptional regulator [Bacillus benzoevorans]|uniref:DNA-binding IclR family transcriptional regulator n=1 Tax=Bacillus benzoevorans TaxID=1456 RepID=A0A7X0LV59_9BACI|nr:IclR family transcriptional regulator [Bacillus benzoevorans]MBB6445273.1 DNA-binding IclR family transcriptional regulator [Bacillus benzoevorans]